MTDAELRARICCAKLATRWCPAGVRELEPGWSRALYTHRAELFAIAEWSDGAAHGVSVVTSDEGPTEKTYDSVVGAFLKWRCRGIDTGAIARRIGCDEVHTEAYDRSAQLGVSARWGDLNHAVRVHIGPNAVDEAVEYLAGWYAQRSSLSAMG